MLRPLLFISALLPFFACAHNFKEVEQVAPGKSLQPVGHVLTDLCATATGIWAITSVVSFCG